MPIMQWLPAGEVSQRVLWIPSEYGILPQEKRIAEQLAQNGIASTFLIHLKPCFWHRLRVLCKPYRPVGLQNYLNKINLIM